MPVDFGLELRISYLRAAAQAIEEEEDEIQTARDFYNGDHSIKLTDRQKEYLRQDFDSYANICKRVVGIPADRLSINEDGVQAVDDQSLVYADVARSWWSDLSESDNEDDADAFSLQGDLYTASLRDGSVGLIVGWDDELQKPTFTPNLLYDGATGLIRFHYDSNNKLLFASKRWTVWDPLNPGKTGNRRLTIYRPGLIDRYEADSTAGGGWRALQPNEIDPVNPIPNPQFWTDTGTAQGVPLGIPVIPFENPIGSELTDVIAIQEMLNHNLGAFDIVIDHHGFPLLYFIGFDFPINSSTGNAEIPDFGPKQAISSSAEHGAAGRIQAADLKEMFEGGVISLVQVLALVKGWPVWLFNLSNEGGQAPSGVALKQMEASLIAQVEAKQRAYSGAWRKAFNLARKLHQLKTNQELPGQIKFEWKPAATSDPLLDIEVKEKKFAIGEIPIVQRWRELNYSEDEIIQMQQDMETQDQFGLLAVTEQ